MTGNGTPKAAAGNHVAADGRVRQNGTTLFGNHEHTGAEQDAAPFKTRGQLLREEAAFARTETQRKMRVASTEDDIAALNMAVAEALIVAEQTGAGEDAHTLRMLVYVIDETHSELRPDSLLSEDGTVIWDFTGNPDSGDLLEQALNGVPAYHPALSPDGDWHTTLSLVPGDLQRRHMKQKFQLAAVTSRDQPVLRTVFDALWERGNIPTEQYGKLTPERLQNAYDQTLGYYVWDAEDDLAERLVGSGRKPVKKQPMEHLDNITTEAGLPVMRGVIEKYLWRENVNVYKLRADDVAWVYQLRIEPGLTMLERYINKLS